MVEYNTNTNFNDAYRQAALGVSIGSNNQIEEFAKILRSGARMVEINLASMYGMGGDRGTAPSKIGKAEREAIGHLAQATDVDISTHASWGINFAGINPQNGQKDPAYSNMAQQEVKAAIEFTDQVSKATKKENTPIIFHASFDNFGNPDKTKMLVAYDQEEEKVIPIGPQKFSNIDENSFKEIYGEKLYNDLKKINGISSSDDKKSVVLSPQAAFEFQKEALRLEISKKKSDIFWRESYIESSKREIANRMIEAAASNDVKKMKELETEAASLDQSLKDIKIEKKTTELQEANIDKRFVPYEEKAPYLAAEGIKNAALTSFKTETKPMILVENPMTPDMSLSNPEDTAKAVAEARRLFAQELMSKEHMSKSEAERLSKELIGINLDVGHVNTFKSYINPMTGQYYNDKDIVEMSKKAKDYIKRYHLADNMGDVDAHLPLGEGNAPVKEIYEQLRKAGVEAPAIMEVFGGTGGIEAGGVISMEYMGAPIYEGEPFRSMPSYSATPYSSLVGDYSSYSDIGLRNDFLAYGGFSGIMPALGGGYMDNKKRGEGFSGMPMV
ncbi:sugar phosphate isomerase/epimerase [Candidatus Parvarchaeota archaeon]|nr:sugar phosphate isomerase/epimerase [Candidatus Parvarchaeota archaeon]